MNRALWICVLTTWCLLQMLPAASPETENSSSEQISSSRAPQKKKAKGITSVIAGSGLTGGGATGDVVLSVDFAGSGSSNNAARSDHTHGSTGENTAVGAAALENNTSFGNTAVGQQAMQKNTTGDSNTAVGNEALRENIRGGFNTAIGAAALIDNTTGGTNTATGHNALQHNTTGGSNTATGAAALLDNIDGNSNTATGVEALEHNSSGFDNTAIGFDTLAHNTTGVRNTAAGSGAMLGSSIGSENTAVGFNALAANTTGSNNTASGESALVNNTTAFLNTANGFEALFFNTTGGSNTAVGSQALFHNTTGGGNIGLGASAGVNITAGSLNIDIANFGVIGDANTLRIGTNLNRAFIDGIRGVTTGVANAVPVVIDSAGQLGTVSSSRRFKREIKSMGEKSESILALRPVTFSYQTDASKTPQFGLIAEEVAAVNPDLVVRDTDGEIYTVRYDAVNAMLLNEFQKEHAELEIQKQKNAELGKRLEALERVVKDRL